MDVVRLIQASNAGRDPERLAMKYRAMRGNPFAFLRGTCALFYARLPRAGVFRSAPLTWVCGDMHVENFGSYKGDNRLVYFDLNDFDEAALAPASWELARMLASLWIAADGLAASRAQARTLCSAFVDAYAAALLAGKAYWIERDTAEGLVRELLDGLRERSRPSFLAARTVLKGRRRRLRVDGRKALPASPAQQQAVREFMAGFSQAQHDPGFYKVLDVARRVAGTGSLGVDRYSILVEGKGSPDGNYLLDLKESQPSSLLPHLSVPQPRWKTQAQRIVTVQKRMQAVSMAFLQPVVMGERAYVLRGLQPTEDRITLARPGLDSGELARAVATMGRLVAWAQLRSAGREGSANADALIDWAGRRKWKDKLLDLSEDCAAQCRRDSATFDTACADGALSG